ncbi:unnamed protein product [Bursaphelenchus okinawaensis]|uniref:CUB domain-containing protein n=1 Tax=Bursaphelenchus okinawaensis TaxID=465554 RepID=A0A811L994_9BILA|nr:unnamed protein product [Bursaphelenchus okinawaensis]CAG9120201.1 unnamed protein product [Bursaphelenchus okinawaensis]
MNGSTNDKMARLSLFVFALVAASAVAQQQPCPAGWFYRSHANQCYYVSNHNLPYSEAVDYCKKDGGTLVSLKNKEEYDYVKELYNNKTGGLYPPWIGLTRDSRWYYTVWRWPDGVTAYSTYWLPAEPAKDEDGACVAWRTIENDGWKTLNCKYAQRFVCKQSSSNCPTKNYEAQSGTLTSLYFPSEYSNNLNCFYHIKVKPDYKIKLEFSSFYTENYFDKLVLYDDYNGNMTNKIDTLSGAYLFKRVFETSENVMTLNFLTDHLITKQGWNATYTALPKEPTHHYYDQSGVITSKNYPNNYPNNEDNLYQIHGLPDKVIRITVNDFQTENKYDYMTIQDGNDIVYSREIARLSGDNVTTPVSYLSSQNNVLIRFFSDISINRKGFSLTYTSENKY